MEKYKYWFEEHRKIIIIGGIIISLLVLFTVIISQHMKVETTYLKGTIVEIDENVYYTTIVNKNNTVVTTPIKEYRTKVRVNGENIIFTDENEWVYKSYVKDDVVKVSKKDYYWEGTYVETAYAVVR